MQQPYQMQNLRMQSFRGADCYSAEYCCLMDPHLKKDCNEYKKGNTVRHFGGQFWMKTFDESSLNFSNTIDELQIAIYYLFTQKLATFPKKNW